MSRSIPRFHTALRRLTVLCLAVSLCLSVATLLLAQAAPPQPAQQSQEQTQQTQPPQAQPQQSPQPQPVEEGFVSLFDGQSLEGWRASENRDSCKVENGLIVVGGPRSHLFYAGPVGNHDFKNFELKLEVMTEPGSNSGIYFHTEYQEEDWPNKGYEAQVNATHTDWRKTGSLYAVEDVREPPAKDNEWFEYHIIVKDKQITLKVNGKTTVDYTEPENPEHLAGYPGRKLTSGTIALQAHDPGSVVRYRNLRIKPDP